MSYRTLSHNVLAQLLPLVDEIIGVLLKQCLCRTLGTEKCLYVQ